MKLQHWQPCLASEKSARYHRIPRHRYRSSPDWCAPSEGTAVPDGIGTLGEGILAGIIDLVLTITPHSVTHRQMVLYRWTGDYLGVRSRWDGICDAQHVMLVGASATPTHAPSDFVTPEDSDGHGSHCQHGCWEYSGLDFYGTP